jgi:hypothetical protein
MTRYNVVTIQTVVLEEVKNTYVELSLRDLGAMQGTRSEWISSTFAHKPGSGSELLQELVVHAFLDENPGSRRAHLTHVVAWLSRKDVVFACEKDKHLQNTANGPLHSLINVRVIEDDGRTLPSKLQRHILEIGFGSSLEDRSSRQRASGERDLFDLRVFRDSLSDRVP